MSELLTLQEIMTRYPGEWVLLEDVETNELMEVRRGRVLWHSRNQDDVSRKAREFGARRAAIVFGGRSPLGPAPSALDEAARGGTGLPK
jgi:hypothetical protein